MNGNVTPVKVWELAFMTPFSHTQNGDRQGNFIIIFLFNFSIEG